jgi:hypothetical protein
MKAKFKVGDKVKLQSTDVMHRERANFEPKNASDITGVIVEKLKLKRTRDNLSHGGTYKIKLDKPIKYKQRGYPAHFYETIYRNGVHLEK